MATSPISPERIVQRQLDAYNDRDIDAFMRLWCDDAEIFEHPSKLVAKGSAEVRERHLLRFKEPNLHGELLQRMVMGQTVVDHERVTRTFRIRAIRARGLRPGPSAIPRRVLLIRTRRISAADSTERQRREGVDALFGIIGDA